MISPRTLNFRGDVRRVISLLQAIDHREHPLSLPDSYDAMGLAMESLDDADRLLCEFPDAELGIVNGHKQHKNFHELVAGPKVRAAAA